MSPSSTSIARVWNGATYSRLARSSRLRRTASASSRRPAPASLLREVPSVVVLDERERDAGLRRPGSERERAVRGLLRLRVRDPRVDAAVEPVDAPGVGEPRERGDVRGIEPERVLELAD